MERDALIEPEIIKITTHRKYSLGDTYHKKIVLEESEKVGITMSSNPYLTKICKTSVPSRGTHRCPTNCKIWESCSPRIKSGR